MKGKRRIAAVALAAPTVVVVAAVSVNGASGASARRVFRGSVPPYATASAKVRPAKGAVHFDVSLPWRNSRELDRVDQAVSDPASPSYGHYLSPAAFRARFSPPVAQVDKVKRWLRDNGFAVTGVSTSRMLIDAVGSVGEVNRAFDTSVHLYRDKHQTLRAPATPLSVPATIANDVDGVLGVGEEPYKPLSTPAAPPPPAFKNAPPCSNYWGRRFARNQPPAYGSVQPWATCGYAPKELQNAYGVHRAIRRGNDGSGEKVAVIDAFAAPTIRRDLKKYSRRHGLPRPRFRQKVFHGCQNGCDIANQQGWYGEETLDLEAVHSMAPGAKLVYLGAADPTFKLIRTLEFAVDHRVAHIITNSYGHVGEAVSHVQVRASEKIHKQAIATGIGIYFSSGDEGDESHVLGYPSTDYPASSPRITAVGGTTLAIGPQHRYRFEVGWGTHVTDKSGNHWDPSPPGSFLYGSGGGTTQAIHRAPLPERRRPQAPRAALRRPGPGGARHLDGRRPELRDAGGRDADVPRRQPPLRRVPDRRHQPLVAAVRGSDGAGRPARALPPRLRQPGFVPALPDRGAPRRAVGPYADRGGPQGLQQRREPPRWNLRQPADSRQGHVPEHEARLRRRHGAGIAPRPPVPEGAGSLADRQTGFVVIAQIATR